MPFVCIDYTSFYFTNLTGTPVPAQVAGKFVQLRNGEMTYLVLSPKGFTKYHANIVERFCMDRGLEGSYDARGERYDISDRAWEIVGGGKYEQDLNSRTIKLYDSSMAYGTFETSALQEQLHEVPQFAGYRILIE